MNKKTILIIIGSLIFILLACLTFLILKKDIKLKLNGKENITINVNEEYKDEKATACYGNIFSCKKIDYSTSGIVDTTKIGTYKIKYKATYKKKSVTMTKIVKVVDKEKPELVVENEEFYVCPNDKLGDYKYSAKDNYDGDITSNVKVEVQYDKLIFSVSDSSNNATKKSFDYKKEDKDAPTITLEGQNKVYVTLGSEYKDPGYSAKDNCDGDITSNVKVSGSVDTNNAGTYNLTYEVSDSFGNVTKENRKVVVYQKNVTVEPKNGTIYLTFDDGPGPHTARLLDVLNKYNVKATFFVTNQYPDYANMITRAYNEGHAIALHTYTHNYAQVYSGVDAYFADLNNINERVKNATNGFESKLVRFPGGSSNTVSKKYCSGIMSTLAVELENRGYKYFDWNVDSDDAGRARSADVVYNNVISRLKSNGYSVVLQHDVKGYSVDAVESIIQYGQSHGFTFKTLDITSPGAHQGINN